MSPAIVATYRLQLTRAFPLPAARELVKYFADLGISHLYLSPVLAARPGSAHGYDVVDHDRVNPELGTEDDLRALAADLHARDMGIILDIVPNHMSASAENARWDDVLERGRVSRFADWFDIEWDAPAARGKVVLPVLGDDLDTVIARDHLKLRIRESGARLTYFERSFPLDPRTLPKEIQLAQLDPAGRPAVEDLMRGPEGRRRFRALLDAQHYRLRFWRKSGAELNYRRFFDVADLVALRMENDAIFEATHGLVLRWVRDGVIDGLRVDHVDGLRAPQWYLGTLRRAVEAARPADARDPCLIVVEKICIGDETLPADWPVDGTTGYDFMTDVEELFLDPAGFAAIEAGYRALRHRRALEFRAVAREGKRRALTSTLRPDVNRLARLAHRWAPAVPAEDFATALVEVIVHLDVYRTYVVEPGLGSDADRRHLTAAFANARTSDAPAAALDRLERAFFDDPAAGDELRAELIARFQQTSGPAAAKGVEDTALYAYMPLASRNEVGAQPDRPLEDAHARMHARNAARMRAWPRTLLAVDTHDTKRSADLRARLDVLTESPELWRRHVSRWRRLNRSRKRVTRGKPAPDPNSEYLYYQSLLGLWPAPRRERRADDLPSAEWLGRARERLVAYMLKAAREAKTRTSWTESDAAFEAALDAFVGATLEPASDSPFLGDVARLTARTADAGFRVALARTILQLTSPGVPDVYQGDELWNFALVDPDNRRPVDYARRAQLLADCDDARVLRQALSGELPLLDDRAKLALLTRLLRFRRDHADLFRDGEYLPLLLDATVSPDVFAFVRRTAADSCLVLARTRGVGQDLAGATVALPGELAGTWRSVLTGRVVELVRNGALLRPLVGDLVPARQPGEILLRSNA